MVSIFQNKDDYTPNTKDKTNLLILDIAQYNRTTQKKIYYYSDLIIQADTDYPDDDKKITSAIKKRKEAYKSDIRNILTKLKEHNDKVLSLLQKINDNQRKNTNLGKNTLANNQDESSIHNVALGTNSLSENIIGVGNIAIGYNSMKNSENSTLYQNKNNVVIGGYNVFDAGNTIISNNGSISDSDSYNLYGNNNTLIGQQGWLSSKRDANNQIVIGNNHNIVVGDNNKVKLVFDNIFTKNLGHTNRRFKKVFTQSITNNNDDAFILPTDTTTSSKYVSPNGEFQSKSRDGMSRSHAGWEPNDNQDLGTSGKQFKDLYLSQGIKIKNKDVIEYPFLGNSNNSIGVKFNNLKVFSSNGNSVSLKNGNITSDIIINSGGRLYLPDNYRGNITFTQSAAKMISDLKLTNNGDYIENLLISARSTRNNYNGYDIDIANKLKPKNSSQYIFSKGFNSNIIKTDMSMRIRIKRINANKIHIKFIAF